MSSTPSHIHVSKPDAIIVWIRNELRINDHLALYSAANDAKKIIPVFVIDGQFLASSPSRRNVILSTLRALREDMRSLGGELFVRRGESHECLFNLLRESGAAGVYLTRQYDPAMRRADAKLRASLHTMGKTYREFKDQVLFEGGEILNGSGEPYRVYSAYRKAWLERSVDIAPPLPPVRSISVPRLEPGEIPAAHEPGLPNGGMSLPAGTEKSGIVTLNNFLENRVGRYTNHRDLLAEAGTSRISHHLSIGSLGIRTVYDAVKSRVIRTGQPRRSGTADRDGAGTYLNQIIWREFYKQILANFPHVTGGAFRREFDEVEWKTDPAAFLAWTEGMTGYPVVDAAMRQLRAEGWMHNRGRMIVASFLTKDLHIDWRMGEAHFMTLLADGDLALNNGGWQWSAGTGTDAQPWFRIFNPVLQGRKFDPDGEYVKRYVPELRCVPAKYIHEPWKMPAAVQREAGCVIGKHYPRRVVDHDVERKVSPGIYGNIAGKSGARLKAAGRMRGRRVLPMAVLSA